MSIDILLKPNHNYNEELHRGVTQKGIHIRKDPAFEPISGDFQIKWNKILYNAEKILVELLLYESPQIKTTDNSANSYSTESH